MGSRILHLVRHGDYLPGETKDGLGHGLSERGRMQAGHLAQVLGSYRLGAIHTSPAPRALETAQIVAERHPSLVPRTSRSLFECIPSVPPKMEGLFRRDLAGYPQNHVSNCREQLDRAFDRFFRTARARERPEILVCHGNVVRYFVTRALSVDANAWVMMRCSQASVTRVVVGPGPHPFILESLNDLCHLPVELRALDD